MEIFGVSLPGLLSQLLLGLVNSNYKVHRAASYDTRWTDHSPVVVDYTV